MDDDLGSAHVEIQFGDLEQQIQVVWFCFPTQQTYHVVLLLIN